VHSTNSLLVVQKEVHDRQGIYGKEHNLLLLVAEPGAEKAMIYFLKGDAFESQLGVRLGLPAPKALQRKVRSLVTEDNIKVFLTLIFMIIIFSGGLYLRTFFTRRAIFKVIEIFYQQNALEIKGAKTPHELGLERPDILKRMTRRRDYKQNALQILMKREIILENEEGKLYLIEERLDQDLRTKMKERLSSGRS
jgi:hypothetical protein